MGVATIRPSARWLATKWPSTSTRSSTMPDVAPRLSTTSFMANVENRTPLAHHLACIRLAVVFFELAASMGVQRPGSSPAECR